MKSLTMTVFAIALLIAITGVPAYAQSATTNTADLPICSVGQYQWQPGLMSGFAMDLADIRYRIPAPTPTAPPAIIQFGPGKLNDNEPLHRGEVASLYGANMFQFQKFNGNGTTGPATNAFGTQVLINGKPATVLYGGYRRDGNSMIQDNNELAFVVPMDTVADSDGKVEAAVTMTDANTGKTCRGQNSPFRLTLDTAMFAPRYELVFPVQGGEAQLRIHGNPIATFPSPVPNGTANAK